MAVNKLKAKRADIRRHEEEVISTLFEEMPGQTLRVTVAVDMVKWKLPGMTAISFGRRAKEVFKSLYRTKGCDGYHKYVNIQLRAQKKSIPSAQQQPLHASSDVSYLHQVLLNKVRCHQDKFTKKNNQHFDSIVKNIGMLVPTSNVCTDQDQVSEAFMQDVRRRSSMLAELNFNATAGQWCQF